MRTRDNRFDREHVAEEIEDLGKSERDAVRSQISRILEHFLKLAHSPADRPRYGWMGSIADARRSPGTQAVTDAAARMPSKALLISTNMRATARSSACENTGKMQLRRRCRQTVRYTLEQMLANDWYPEPPAETK